MSLPRLPVSALDNGKSDDIASRQPGRQARRHRIRTRLPEVHPGSPSASNRACVSAPDNSKTLQTPQTGPTAGPTAAGRARVSGPDNGAGRSSAPGRQQIELGICPGIPEFWLNSRARRQGASRLRRRIFAPACPLRTGCVARARRQNSNSPNRPSGSTRAASGRIGIQGPRVLTGLFRGSEMLPRNPFPEFYMLEHSLSWVIPHPALPSFCRGEGVDSLNSMSTPPCAGAGSGVVLDTMTGTSVLPMLRR